MTFLSVSFFRLTFFIFLLILGFAHAQQKSNVLFISVDDLNDWIGCLNGHPQALTPNMDRLAKRGVLFANAHCAAPACNPSRAAVFSGQMPERTGVWSNRSESLLKLRPGAKFLTTIFSQSGYHTLGTGKLLHKGGSAIFNEYYSISQRWSPFPKKAVLYTKKELPSKSTDNPRHVLKDSLGRKVVLPLNRMPSDRKPKERDGESFDWGGFDVPDSDFGDTQITDWAIKKLGGNFNKPFFMGIGYYRPHIPLFAPEKYFERFKDNPGRLPSVRQDDLKDLGVTGKKWAREAVTAGSHETVLKYKQWQAAVEAYLACTTYVDYEIGRLLDALDKSGYAGNTHIILWSDHGWHLGEKEHWGKWTGWERSTRVPMIILPAKNTLKEFRSGGRCEQPVGLIDIFPTLMELCGLKLPKDLDGQSLVPLLIDPEKDTGRVLKTTFDTGNISLRTGRWRYLRYADGEQELYDLKADPNEWLNLINDPRHAKVKERFNLMK